MATPLRNLRRSGNVFAVIWRNRSLRLMAVARLASVTGRWAATIALAVVAYRRGGAPAVGLLGVVRILPAALAGPVATVFLRRIRSDRFLTLVSVLRTAVMAGVAAALLLDTGLPVVFALVAVEALASTITRPLQTAALPLLAQTPRELTAANLALTTIESSGMLFGPLVAGVVLSVSSPGVALVVTASAYALSAVLIRLIPAWEAESASGATAPLGGVMDGVRRVYRDRRLRLIVGLYAAENLVAGSLNVLVVVAALRLLDLGDSGVGVLNGSIGVGGLAGALAVGAFLGRGRTASNLGVGLVLCGASIALIAAFPRTAPTVLLLVILGVGIAFVDFAAVTLLQRTIPTDVLPHVFSVLQSVFVGTLGVGAVLAPPLVSWLGIRGALLACGAVLPALALVQWRPLASLNAVSSVDEQVVDRLRRTPIFAPLNLPTIERLARTALPVDAPAGVVVVRQGDLGDRFYVVLDGRVQVSHDGHPVAELGPGDGFGEIALLRSVPRTATVTTIMNSTFLAVARDDFLGAVSGAASSRSVADELVDTRLGELRSALASV